MTEVAQGMIRALTATPALLTLVVMNLIMIGLVSYIVYDLVNDVGARQQLILDRCLPHASQDGRS